MFENIPSFLDTGAWILAGVVIVGAAVDYISKAWHAFHKPAHEAKTRVDEVDKSMQDKIDEALAEHETFKEYFKNDSNDIKLIKHELLRQGHVDATVVNGVYLIIQHLTTGNHTDEMKQWMREFASSETESHIKEGE